MSCNTSPQMQTQHDTYTTGNVHPLTNVTSYHNHTPLCIQGTKYVCSEGHSWLRTQCVKLRKIQVARDGH